MFDRVNQCRLYRFPRIENRLGALIDNLQDLSMIRKNNLLFDLACQPLIEVFESFPNHVVFFNSKNYRPIKVSQLLIDDGDFRGICEGAACLGYFERFHFTTHPKSRTQQEHANDEFFSKDND